MGKLTYGFLAILSPILFNACGSAVQDASKNEITPPATNTGYTAYGGLWSTERIRVTQKGCTTPLDSVLTVAFENGALTITDRDGTYLGTADGTTAHWSGLLKRGAKWERFIVGNAQFKDGSFSANLQSSISDTPDIQSPCDETYILAGNRVANSAPPTPTNFKAIATAENTMHLTWQETATNERTVHIMRYYGDLVDFSEIARVPANVREYYDMGKNGVGLTPGQSYRYRAFASNDAGNSANTEEATAFTPNASAAPTKAPTGILATVTNAMVILTWKDSDEAKTGFTILRSPARNGTYVVVGKTPRQQTSYADNSTSADAAYFYHVESTNPKGSSANSDTIEVHTPALPTVTMPNAPVISSAQQFGENRAIIRWQGNATNNTTLSVLRNDDGGTTYTTVATLFNDSTGFVDAGADIVGGLASGKTYHYQLKAENSKGSTISNTVDVAIAAALNPPTSFTDANLALQNMSNSQVTLNWVLKNSINNVQKLVLKRAPHGDSLTDLVTLPPNALSYTDTTVVGLTAYDYGLVAVNSAGSNFISKTLAVNTPQGMPAPANGLAYVQSMGGGIVVSWDNGGSNLKYNLYRSDDNDVTYNKFADSIGINATSSRVTYTDNNGIAAKHAYTYRVFSYETDSAQHSEETKINAQAAPYQLAILVNTGSVNTISTSISPKIALTTCPTGTFCILEFAAGATVTLTAAPTPPNYWNNWTGCSNSSGDACTINVRSDTIVTLDVRSLIIIRPPPIFVTPILVTPILTP